MEINQSEINHKGHEGHEGRRTAERQNGRAVER
jgi:hypothetical protein